LDCYTNYNIFHVSRLEPWYGRGRDQLLDKPHDLPDLEDDEVEWEVEEVRDKRVTEGDTYYLLKWKGWPSEYDEWIPTDNMGNTQEAVGRYQKVRGLRRRRPPEDAGGKETMRKQGRPRKQKRGGP
jgi:hypothetical protein